MEERSLALDGLDLHRGRHVQLAELPGRFGPFGEDVPIEKWPGVKEETRLRQEGMGWDACGGGSGAEVPRGAYVRRPCNDWEGWLRPYAQSHPFSGFKYCGHA